MLKWRWSTGSGYILSRDNVDLSGEEAVALLSNWRHECMASVKGPCSYKDCPVGAKWPAPAAYIVSRPMAVDRFQWCKEQDALTNVPLYTKDQVEQMLRTAGVPTVQASSLPQEPVAWGVIAQDGTLLLAEKRGLLAFFDNPPRPLVWGDTAGAQP